MGARAVKGIECGELFISVSKGFRAGQHPFGYSLSYVISQRIQVPCDKAHQRFFMLWMVWAWFKEPGIDTLTVATNDEFVFNGGVVP